MRNILIAAALALTACATTPAPASPPITLTGEITRADHQTYRELPFTVPAGATRISIDFTYDKDNRTVIDLGWEPLGVEPDTDLDGLLDSKDACPKEPEDKDGVDDADGCPEDNDKDGLPDERLLRRAAGRADEVILLTYGGRTVDIWWQKDSATLSKLNNLKVLSLAVEDSRALAALAERNMTLGHLRPPR